ncbi:MAG TPA: DUF2946 family protein [Burkholderiaceae bacterium]|nr:DUF2946 family protein [Burkholderiaceae bacterium]
MDPEVLAAMARWPDVPDVYGWLALDGRGNWLLRGEPIGNASIRAFIGRNYAADASGRWYLQNGPQRVFVRLAAAPWICRFDGDRIVAHDGRRIAALRRALLDDDGRLWLDTDIGPAIVDDRDGALVLERIVDGGGAPLGVEAIEAWLRGERTAWLRSGSGGMPVAIGRRPRAEIPRALAFEPDPRPA